MVMDDINTNDTNNIIKIIINNTINIDGIIYKTLIPPLA